MVTTWRPPLPELPPVRTTPLNAAEKAELVDALQACRRAKAWADVRKHAQKGLARLWLHLVLERGLDPRKAAPGTSAGHQAVLKPYLDACVRLSLGDRAELAWDVQDVADLAGRLWDQAKAEQAASRASQAPLLGLEGLG